MRTPSGWLSFPWFVCRGRKVIAVRHADVTGGGQDPSLSPAGQARAGELVHLFEGASLAKILVSNFARTQQTAQPVATAHGLTPQVLAANDVNGYVAAIKALPPWSTVLVVGHSDTVPKIIGALTGLALPGIPAVEFDRLYVAIGSHHLELRYGATSP